MNNLPPFRIAPHKAKPITQQIFLICGGSLHKPQAKTRRLSLFLSRPNGPIIGASKAPMGEIPDK